MPLDAGAVRRGCRGAKVEMQVNCAAPNLNAFAPPWRAGTPLTIGCTQEAPLFAEVARRAGTKRISFRQRARNRRLVVTGR